MEATEFDHHSIKTYYREPPFDLYHHPTTTYPPPSPSHVHVHIDFLHQTTHRFYNRPHLNQNHDHDNENHHSSRSVFVATRRPPPVKASICIPAPTFKSYTESHQIISQEVKELQVHPSLQDTVANQVIATCLRVLNTVSSMGRRIVTVPVELLTVEVHTREEREWVERGLAESLAEREGGENRTVAASMAAVRGLKRKRVVKNGVEESCRVCLEEFLKGERVTFLPCRHVFHEGCIQTWLGISHVCPICRFKMPTR